jgi:hypothetical protein
MAADPQPLTVKAGATALAAFFTEVSPRLLADVRAAGVLGGTSDADVEREWLAVALHAVIRGVVASGLEPERAADIVDALHDLLLPALPAEPDEQSLRRHLAARYGGYDGITRTLGKDGAARVPVAIAEACAKHLHAARPAELAATLAPLIEALAEGATQALADAAEPALQLPPLEPLRLVTSRLDAAGIEWAVGGSGLLAALGLVDRVNDWDVQVESEAEPLQFLFATLPHSFHGHGGCHADWKLAFSEPRTEVIPRFAFFVPGADAPHDADVSGHDTVVRVRLHVSGHWRGLPIASPEGWACAYWLMGRYDEPSQRARRMARAELLFGWLERHGADAARLEAMLAEPLPPALATRLTALRR